MKIQKGIVKYRDRNDIICTYGITDDGMQYYFLDEGDSKRLSNGNRIVSTALVEAIDPMAKASNIGVINADGVMVIPFENKSIKPVNDSILIVERANPVTQSVLDAISERSDPVAAPKLVSTSATIKDKMNAVMGKDGRFLVNDQFSEATICDVDGHNLLQDEYYSFIGIANDELYLCKNTPESDILEFSLKDNSLVGSSQKDVLNVQNIGVESGTVDNALSDEITIPTDLANAVGFAAPDTNDSLDSMSSSVDSVQEITPQDTNIENVTSDDSVVSTDSLPVSESNPVDNFQSNTNIDGQVDGQAEKGMSLDEDNSQTLQMPSADEMSAIKDSNDKLESNLDEPFTEVESDAVSIPTAVNDLSSLGETVDAPASTDSLATSTDNALSDHQNTAESNLVDEVDHDSVVSIPNDVATTASIPNDVATTASIPDDVATTASIPDDMSQNVVPIPEDSLKTQTDINNDVIEESVPDIFAGNASTNDSASTLSSNVVNPLDVASTVDKDNNGILDSNETQSNSFDHSNYLDDGMNSYYNYSSDANSSLGFDSYSFSSGDDIMGDVARSMSDLMRQNREQKATISQMQGRLEESESQRRILTDRLKEQSMRFESLSSKLRSMDSLTSRLESKIREQEKIIQSQERELKSLQPQMESKQDLVK